MLGVADVSWQALGMDVRHCSYYSPYHPFSLGLFHDYAY